MKVSIITYHRVYNYGAALQAYATEKIFEKLGYEAEIVDYIPKKVKRYGGYRQISYESKMFYSNPLKKFIVSIVKMPSYRKQRKVFDKFLDVQFKMSRPYYSIQELRDNPPEADLYCTGSDQVWNNIYSDGFDEAFFLPYAKVGKKFAFSASFGRKDFTEEERRQLLSYIKDYQAVSVREKSGLDIINNLPIHLKEHTLDPTLVLEKREWEKLIKKDNAVEEGYILVYQLHGNSPAETYANIIGKKQGKKVYRIITMMHQKSNGSNRITIPDVEMFLTLFAKADLVVTDSFHGTAFSINFNKNFVVTVPQRTGERIASILELTKLSNRIAHSSTEALQIAEENIDFDRCEEILALEREKAVSYIRDAIKLCNDDTM